MESISPTSAFWSEAHSVNAELTLGDGGSSSAARRAPSRASTRCIAVQPRLPADLRPACRSSSDQRQAAAGAAQYIFAEDAQEQLGPGDARRKRARFGWLWC